MTATWRTIGSSHGYWTKTNPTKKCICSAKLRIALQLSEPTCLKLHVGPQLTCCPRSSSLLYTTQHGCNVQYPIQAPKAHYVWFRHPPNTWSHQNLIQPCLLPFILLDWTTCSFPQQLGYIYTVKQHPNTINFTTWSDHDLCQEDCSVGEEVADDGSAGEKAVPLRLLAHWSSQSSCGWPRRSLASWAMNG